jgi:iron complex outermembrane receptor protein
MSHPMNYSSNGIRYYPAIDIQYKKGKGLLFAHSGTGSRLPTYTDWFYSDSGNQGNSSLVPENAFTAETGFQYQNQNFFVQGSYFFRDVKNQIDWILNTETNKYVAGNLTQCQFTGSEFAVKWNNINKKSWLNIGNVSLRNTLLTNNIKFDGASSKYLNDHLTHQAVMQLGINNGEHIQHQIIARRYQRFNTEIPSLILDWRTQYNNANWTVFADITNLNNQEYKLSGFVTMPGRFFNLGVQYTLK